MTKGPLPCVFFYSVKFARPVDLPLYVTTFTVLCIVLCLFYYYIVVDRVRLELDRDVRGKMRKSPQPTSANIKPTVLLMLIQRIRRLPNAGPMSSACCEHSNYMFTLLNTAT